MRAGCVAKAFDFVCTAGVCMYNTRCVQLFHVDLICVLAQNLHDTWCVVGSNAAGGASEHSSEHIFVNQMGEMWLIPPPG